MFASRFLPALLSVTVLAAFLAGCSGADPQADTAGEASEMTNPPGVAQALSLAGQLESQSDRSEYERALDCAVALRVMASALVPLTAGTQSREVRTINAAANEFENRARSADGREGRDLAQDIEEGVAEKMSDTTGQAQLAIACANARS